MKRALFLLLLVALLSSAVPVGAIDRYVEGVSIRFVDYPAVVHPGEKIQTKVQVINMSENRVEGWLRTYVYGFYPSILYPPPEFYDVVLLNEGGWYPNEVWVEVDGGSSETYALELSLKPCICTAAPTATVRLRTRFRIIENGTSVNLAPPDTREVVLYPYAVSSELISVKIFMGVLVGGMLVISAKHMQRALTNERHPRMRRRRFARNKRGIRV